MKSNKCKSQSNFHRFDAQERNQISPYVTYSTLVFMYEWEENKNSQGNIYHSNMPYKKGVEILIYLLQILILIFLFYDRTRREPAFQSNYAIMESGVI